MVIKNCRIIYKDHIEWGSIKITAGKIEGVNLPYEEYEEVIDAKGLYLAPGFIDVHIHGAGGYDTLDGTKEALHGMAKALIKHGVTAFVPTTMTVSREQIRGALEGVSAFKALKQVEAARVLGVHLEGPFVNGKALGAQHPDYLLEPSILQYEVLTRGYEDLIQAVTLAPELEGAKVLIDYLDQMGINCALGHTHATYEEVMEAREWGITHATHLYNAMTPFSHRAPGVVGAVFDSDLTAEVIADGIHSSYAALRIAFKQKGTDQMMLVSDAMMATCMPEGQYTLGGQDVYVKDGAARLANGTLAGSILTLDQAIRNVYEHCKLPLYEAIKMATYNPAYYCKVHDHKGMIAAGYDADLVLFDDEIKVKHVFVKGQEVYQHI